MDTSANTSVYEARTLTAEQYSSYKEEVFVLRSKSIYETIKCNKLSLYKNTKLCCHILNIGESSIFKARLSAICQLVCYMLKS